MCDFAKVRELLGDESPEAQCFALRQAGYSRARDILTQHRDRVALVANALTEAGELDQQALEKLLK
jgi:ATP-dependent Zn protease